MPEYLELQAKETETMNFWANFINNEPENFKKQYKQIGILDQCKLRAFIQIRDSELYQKMLKILGEE